MRLGQHNSDETKQKISESCRRVFEEDPSIAQRMSKAQLNNKNALGHTLSDEARQAMSDTIRRRYNEDPSYASRISESLKQHYAVHLEAAQRISNALIGRTPSEEVLQRRTESLRQAYSDPKLRQRVSESMRLAHERDPSISQRKSDAMKQLWRDPEYAQRLSEAQHRKPNETEQLLQTILNEYFPNEWKYVGDGQVWIEGKNPDFINIDGKKQVIEMFGIYWHDPNLFPNRPTEDELIAHYKKFEFDCLVLWEHVVWCERQRVVEKVRMLRNDNTQHL